MKKLFISLFAAAALLPFSVSCDSGANEPDAPIESGNPADSIPADTLPQVTPPDQKPQGLDSVLIPDGLELVDYVPYTGSVEPLSEQVRPIYVDSRRWYRVSVYEKQSNNSCFTQTTNGNADLEGTITKRFSSYYEGGTRTSTDYFIEDNTTVYEAYAGESYYFKGEYHCDWDYKIAYDVYPSASASFPCYLQSADLTIVSRGTITLRGKTLRAAKVWTGKRYQHRLPYDYWVEGIGSLFGLIGEYDCVYSSCCSPQPFDLLIQCVDKNGELIYDYRDFDPDLYEELEILSDADRQATPGQLTHFARPTVDISAISPQ